ncbi:apolipoprotein N-acyltransferase [soil metagenome]
MTGGLLLLAGHPPLALWWTGFLALVPLVALGRDLAGGPRRRGAAFGWGFLAGTVLFMPLIHWLVPFGFAAFGLLSLIQAAYVGLFVVVLSLYGERRGRALVAVAAWVGLEALRGTVPLDGFTWGGLAYTQADGGLALGVARTFGSAGVSAILAAVAVAAEEAIRSASRSLGTAQEAEIPADAVFRAMQVPLLTVLGVMVLAVLASGQVPEANGRTASIGIVQGGDTRGTSAAGVNRVDTGRIERVVDLMLAATEPFADDTPDVVIWPENALDGDVRLPEWQQIASRLDEALQLVAPSPILGGDTEFGTTPQTRFNNMTVFTTDGIGPSYTKRVPVPFGEYVPARSWLDWFPPLEQIPSDVLPGTGPQVLDVGGARIGGVICFENTYGNLVRDQVRSGADVLVVSTNNSSFGDTAMSAQHLAFSQLRAVETGRWVVHAGLSGISAFITPEGEVVQRTELFQPAAVQMDVPLIEGLTPAMRIGDAVAWLATGLLLLALVVVVLDRRRPGPPPPAAEND